MFLLKDPRERLIMNLKKEIKVLKSDNQILREHAHIAPDNKSPHDGTQPGELLTITTFSQMFYQCMSKMA